MPSARRRLILLSAVACCLALTGCAANPDPASTPLATSFQKGVQVAEADSGSAGDRGAVREATTAAMTNLNRAFVIPVSLRGEPLTSVLSTVTSASATEARTELLSRDRSPALAAAVQKSFSWYAAHEFGPDWNGSSDRTALLDSDVWSSTTFHVDRWQGVQVAGDTARVLVRGEDRGASWSGAHHADSWAQYKLILHRDASAPHGWRVVRQQAATTAA